jgi:ubiquinone/menaquinone biosynthesis C-methylase UbiE
MKISDPNVDLVCDEQDIYERLLSLKDAEILELGCGKAEKTLAIARHGKVATIVALEVDEIQHAENMRRDAPANVRFELGGAQAIPATDRSFDIVFMFKSLHHVPLEEMDAAMTEIHRVLKPDGMAYISEPVFAGEFNEILRLFHDEQAVREAAFAAVGRAIAAGSFELASQTFFASPMRFESFAQFENQVLNVTHTQHRLSAELYRQVQQKFMRHLTPEGAAFNMPVRVDLLHKRG